MNFTSNSFASRLWEIRVSQVPFSQRAPQGCLQYFTEPQGFLQTFNFAENGRHLANQNYKVCFKQDTGMCSIAYEPCNQHSFRIGPSESIMSSDTFGSQSSSGGSSGGIGGGNGGIGGGNGGIGGGNGGSGGALADNLAPLPPSFDTVQSAGVPGDLQAADTNNPAETVADPPEGVSNDAVEGSGGDELADTGNSVFPSFDSIRDIFFSFRNMRLLRQRQKRQLYSTCTDRITMPCIIEDFIGVGMGAIPSCVPVHCGLSLCTLGVSPCRLESSVAPFRLGIRFGDGRGKGSPEDNIGACLKFNQLPCAR